MTAIGREEVPASTTSLDAPAPAGAGPELLPHESLPRFVIGVTGEIGLCNDAAETARLRRLVGGALLWAYRLPENVERTPEIEEWESYAASLASDDYLGERLEAPASWGRVLSSCAPGADWLVGEVARALGIEVRIPLWDTVEGALENSTTWDPDVSPCGDAAAQIGRTLASLSAQIDLVDMQSDVEEPHTPRENMLESRLELPPNATSGDRNAARRLRYRSAGEYIACHSHLLIAITGVAARTWVEEEVDASAIQPDVATNAAAMREAATCGSETIIRIARQGPTPGLLATSPAFAWSDSTSVIHLATPRPGHSSDAAPATDGAKGTVDLRKADVALLRPFDLCPLWNIDSLHSDDREILGSERAIRERYRIDWDRRSDHVLRKSLEWWRDFLARSDRDDEVKRQLVDESPERRAREYEKLVRKLAKIDGEQVRLEPSEKVSLFLLGLGEQWAFRRRAASYANRLGKQIDGALQRQFLMAAVTALLVALAGATFDSGAAETGNGWNLASGALALASTLAFLLFGVFPVRRLKQERVEARWLDCRALAEGVRVQFWWSLCGFDASAATNYMQRQRNELDWIRTTVRTVAAPVSKWRRRHFELAWEDRHTLLRQTIAVWLGGQRDYFRQALHRRRRALGFWTLAARSCAVAALVHAGAVGIRLAWISGVQSATSGGFPYDLRFPSTFWFWTLAALPMAVIAASTLCRHSWMRRLIVPYFRRLTPTADQIFERFGYGPEFAAAVSELFWISLCAVPLATLAGIAPPASFDDLRWLLLGAIVFVLAVGGYGRWRSWPVGQRGNQDNPRERQAVARPTSADLPPLAHQEGTNTSFGVDWFKPSFLFVAEFLAWLFGGSAEQGASAQETDPLARLGVPSVAGGLLLALAFSVGGSAFCAYGGVSGYVQALVFFGALLGVLAGLAAAWPSANLLSEEVAEFAEMEGLYRSAAWRAESQLRRMQEIAEEIAGSASDGTTVEPMEDPRYRAHREHLESLLVEVGRQALDENSEWLILHRSRPIEPVQG